MGSRAAVGVANLIKGSPQDAELASYVRGVICLSYPLYPPSQMNNMRDKPLGELEYPTLFLSGTRDNMAECSLLEKAVAAVPCESKIYWIEGADHGHKVSGRKPEDVNEEVGRQMAEWCQHVLVKPKPTGQDPNTSSLKEKPQKPYGSCEAVAPSAEKRNREGKELKKRSKGRRLPSSEQKTKGSATSVPCEVDARGNLETSGHAASTKANGTHVHYGTTGKKRATKSGVADGKKRVRQTESETVVSGKKPKGRK